MIRPFSTKLFAKNSLNAAFWYQRFIFIQSKNYYLFPFHNSLLKNRFRKSKYCNYFSRIAKVFPTKNPVLMILYSPQAIFQCSNESRGWMSTLLFKFNGKYESCLKTEIFLPMQKSRPKAGREPRPWRLRNNLGWKPKLGSEQWSQPHARTFPACPTTSNWHFTFSIFLK